MCALFIESFKGIAFAPRDNSAFYSRDRPPPPPHLRQWFGLQGEGDLTLGVNFYPKHLLLVDSSTALRRRPRQCEPFSSRFHQFGW